MRYVLAFLALLTCACLSLGSSGTLTITSVTNNGSGSYTLGLSSSTGISVGDHLGGTISSGRGCVYLVTSVPSSTSVIVGDVLQDDEATTFGVPRLGDAWYGTPALNTMSRAPYTAKGWDAPWRRNSMVASKLGEQFGRVDPTGPASVSGIFSTVTTTNDVITMSNSADGRYARVDGVISSGHEIHTITSTACVITSNPLLVTKFALANTTCRFFVGLTNETATTMVSADSPSTSEFVGLQARASDTNWHFVHADGGAITRVDTSVAKSTSTLYLVIDCYSAGNATLLRLYSSARVQLAVTRVTTQLPSTALAYMIGCENTDGATECKYDLYWADLRLRP